MKLYAQNIPKIATYEGKLISLMPHKNPAIDRKIDCPFKEIEYQEF